MSGPFAWASKMFVKTSWPCIGPEACVKAFRGDRTGVRPGSAGDLRSKAISQHGGSAAIDLAVLAESSKNVGSDFHVLAPCRLSGAVLDGLYDLKVLRQGLFVHVSDAVDLHDLVTSTVLNPGLTIQIFLEGPVQASLGGKALLPEAGMRGPRALLTARARPELLERRGQKGRRTRKLSVTLSHDWLADSGFIPGQGEFDVQRFARSHLAQRSWTPDGTLIAHAGTILNSPPFGDGAFAKLTLESRVLELVALVFRVQAGTPGGQSLDPRDLKRMRLVEEYLAESETGAVGLDELARNAHISVSTLQRLFQTVHGMSASEFIRAGNLERSRVLLDRGISIKEAAFFAGYSSPANFSTAFRRHFGYSPRQAGKGSTRQ